MNKWLLSIFMLVSFIPGALAYVDDYPPFKFKESPPRCLKTEPLITDQDLYRTEDKVEYTSKDGKVFAAAGWVNTSNSSDCSLLIRDGGFALVDEVTDFHLTAVYRADVDGNGKKDFIVFKDYLGQGSGCWHDLVEIYLKEREGVFHRIAYDTENAVLGDFVARGGKGRFAVLITDQVYWEDLRSTERGHWCFSYDIYEFKGFRLVNANAKHRGFPKFVWWKFKPNDEDFPRMTRKQKAAETKTKNASIQCQIVTTPWKGYRYDEL